MLLAPHDLRPPRGLPAREPSAPRAFGSARRLEARPGPAGPVAASNRVGLGARVLALAPPPPTGTAARPTNPSGALHTGVAVSLCVAECVGSKPGQAPLPPTAAAARPTNPSGGLHTGGTVSLCVAGTLTATP